jgi:hypothetical protein
MSDPKYHPRREALKTIASVERDTPAGKAVESMIMGEELLEAAGEVIGNQVDKLFKGPKEAIKEAAIELKKRICGCSDETEPHSSHSIPLAKPALKARE